MSTVDIDKARHEFWEKMCALVLEYDLYTYDPNIKEMERDLMDAYDQSRTTLKAELLAKMPKPVGNNPHICRPKFHTKEVDFEKEGFTGYSDMLKAHPEYANCVHCGAPPKKYRFETTSDAAKGYNQAITEITKIVNEL